MKNNNLSSLYIQNPETQEFFDLRSLTQLAASDNEHSLSNFLINFPLYVKRISLLKKTDDYFEALNVEINDNNYEIYLKLTQRWLDIYETMQNSYNIPFFNLSSEELIDRQTQLMALQERLIALKEDISKRLIAEQEQIEKDKQLTKDEEDSMMQQAIYDSLHLTPPESNDIQVDVESANQNAIQENNSFDLTAFLKNSLLFCTVKKEVKQEQASPTLSQAKRMK